MSTPALVADANEFARELSRAGFGVSSRPRILAAGVRLEFAFGSERVRALVKPGRVVSLVNVRTSERLAELPAGIPLPAGFRVAEFVPRPELVELHGQLADLADRLRALQESAERRELPQLAEQLERAAEHARSAEYALDVMLDT